MLKREYKKIDLMT